ncbi:transporter substrate-binding domain-containing protein [Ectopseudomonas mendocina]|uniref:Transporter substrate-binding domain-containing protein n=1 Tax=Ectopseudomonas mendocina TaxID=300 RepID=A0ABZ2RD67_ECTME
MLRNLIYALGLMGCVNYSLAAEVNFVTEEFPPFSYSRGAMASGAFPEIVMLVCQHLKWSCSIEVFPWRRALQLAEDGEVDGIFTLIDSPARRASFYLTPMIAVSHYNFYTRRENDFIFTKPDDLKGAKIGVYGPSGTSYILEETLKDVDDIDISLITNNQRLLLMLSAGRFGKKGIVVLNNDVARHLIDHDRLYALRNAGYMASTSYAIGFSRKKVTPEIFTAFNDGLKRLKQSGEVAQILKRYALEEAK